MQVLFPSSSAVADPRPLRLPFGEPQKAAAPAAPAARPRVIAPCACGNRDPIVTWRFDGKLACDRCAFPLGSEAQLP
jgi:hypothetical protein